VITNVFVYGTLKHQQLRGKMWPRRPQAVVPAVLRALLHDLGPYPGITPGNDWVLGELWQFLDEDMQPTLEVLDAIEGYEASTDSGLYRRGTVSVYLPMGAMAKEESEAQAFTYWIADPNRIAASRKIAPCKAWCGLHVAEWPDALARVPMRIEDE